MEPAILVIRGGALGDFILTLPVLAALQRQFPKARLDVLAHLPFASLVVAAGVAESIHSIDSPQFSGMFSQEGSWPTEISDYFSQFSLIVSYVYDPNRIFQTNIARCSKARFIAGPYRADESARIHATKALLGPLEELGISNADETPSLKVPRAANCLAGGANWLAAHPGSGSARKNWPEENWFALTRRLIEETGWNLLLIGGEAEGTRAARLAATLPAERTNVAQDWSLVELAAAMQECAAFLGHDSGITHLAAALGLPGLALWGESVEEIWRPRGDGMKVLRSAKGIKELEVETVFTALAGKASAPPA